MIALLSLVRVELPFSRVQALQHLASVPKESLALAALHEFGLALAFACLWFVVGRWRDMQLSHLGVPLFVWSLQATLGTADRLAYGLPHPLDLAEYVLESSFALALIVGLLSLAIGFARVRQLTLGSLFGLAGAGLAVLTVFLDWCFVLLLTPALRP